MSLVTSPSPGTRTTLLDLPDNVLAVIFERVSRGTNGIADLARASCVDTQTRALAHERMRRMRTLDVRNLGRRARLATPHLARRCASLVTIVCDRTNITDECVTALLAASERTLRKLSLADCRHLRNLHEHAFAGAADDDDDATTFPLAELNLRGSCWSPTALASILRAARRTLVALNLSSTHVSHSSLRSGDDFGEIARRVLECRSLRRLGLGAPVDFVVPCLAMQIFAELERGGGGGGESTTNVGDGTVGWEELSLAQNGAANDAVLQGVSRRCPDLMQLDLRGTTASSEGVVAFVESAACARKLRSLLLGGCDSLDDGGLAMIASRCDELLELDLSMHNRVGSGGIEALAGCASLRRLRISRNAKVTAESLGKLARMGGLEELSAVRCRRAGEPALRSLLRDLRECGEEAGGRCRIDWVGDDFAWTGISL